MSPTDKSRYAKLRRYFDCYRGQNRYSNLAKAYLIPSEINKPEKITAKPSAHGFEVVHPLSHTGMKIISAPKGVSFSG